MKPSLKNLHFRIIITCFKEVHIIQVTGYCSVRLNHKNW